MDSTKHFAICIRNDGYQGTLETRKLYEVLEDPSAAKRNSIRVIDESGEDYLYPEAWFVRVALPETVEAQLLELVSK
jgi:hypothetical protein